MTQWLATAVAILSFSATAYAIDITTCGQLVPRRQTGVLQTDLNCGETVKRCFDAVDIVCNVDADCPSVNGCKPAGVFLERGAKLDLNGHTLTYDGSFAAVQCRFKGRFTVGNGTLRCVTLPTAGVYTGRGSIYAHDLAVENCTNGIEAIGGRVYATGVTATGNMFGLYANHLRIVNVTASGNLQGGVGAIRTLRAMNLRTDNNTGPGADTRHFRIDGFESHGNTGAGLLSRRISANRPGFRGRLSNANVTGNFYEGAPMDILATRAPFTENVTCEWSAMESDPAGPGLGICSQQ